MYITMTLIEVSHYVAVGTQIGCLVHVLLSCVLLSKEDMVCAWFCLELAHNLHAHTHSHIQLHTYTQAHANKKQKTLHL